MNIRFWSFIFYAWCMIFLPLLDFADQFHRFPPFLFAPEEEQKIDDLAFMQVLKQNHGKLKRPFLALQSPPKFSHSLTRSIVEPENEISDFKARFEMAKILSHHKETIPSALTLFENLKKQNPRYPPLMLELSRIWIGQGKFSRALHQLSILLKENYPIAYSSKHSTAPSSKQKKKDRSNQDTIVPAGDQIDDDQARLELARVLSHHDKDLDEALQNYQILLRKYPHKIVLILEISRIYIRQKQYDAALVLLYPELNENPLNPDLMIEAAHAEQALGHLKESQELFLRALPLAKNQRAVLLDYANTLMQVGSFYKAEEIYRNAANAEPRSLDLSLKLAWNFVSAERYEEAEGLYRSLLLHHPNNPKVLEAIATLKILEKDFLAALNILSTLNDLIPRNSSYLLLQANAFYQNESYLEALEVFQELRSDSKYELKALIGMGKIYQKLGQQEMAQTYFQKAYAIDPTLIEAQYYLAGPQRVIEEEFISQAIEQAATPENLVKWSELYAENGMAGILAFYEAALRIDADYFPAQLGLAQALSSVYRFNESIEIYQSLLNSFPDASKMMIAIARVLSWGKQYHCSFRWYDRVIALNPEDPVPRREKARAAYWGYFFDKSKQTYEELLHPAVDELLWESLVEFNNHIFNPLLSPGFDLLAQSCSSIYSGYERFSEFFAEIQDQLPSCQRLYIEEIIIQYLPLYLIQKSVSLESYAKELDWRNYYFHALPVYRELAAFSPGNLEGLYGYAQDFCNIGLCHSSRSLYYHILNISPNHNLVTMALERNLLKEHWLVQFNYLYWKERGSGQFSQSQIARHQFDQVLCWNPECNFQIRFMQNEWIEHAFIKNKSYPAEGQTIEVDRNFNGYIKGSAGVTRKNYFQRFVSRYTGFANLWLNCNDYCSIGIGFERKNEIYNYFSLKEGIQAKIYTLSIISNLTHYWTMAASYRHLDYNDKNDMNHVEVLTTYCFSDDPDIFKIILQGSYRNTAHLTKTIVNKKGKIVNVIHPYWTPEDYYSNSITLEYRHNYAWFNYCEGPQRYLDIKITGEDDTARNPSLQFTFEWKHEFMYHLGFELKGLIHQSRLWNAEGAWLNVYYRF